MRLINRDLGRAMRGLEVDMGVSKCTIRRSSCTSATVTVGSPWSSLQLWWWLGSSPTRGTWSPPLLQEGSPTQLRQLHRRHEGCDQAFDGSGGWGVPKHLSAGWGPCQQCQVDPDLVLREPPPPSGERSCGPQAAMTATPSTTMCREHVSRPSTGLPKTLWTPIFAGFSAMPCAEIMHAFSR